MQLKNIPIFTKINLKAVPHIIYKSRFIIAVVTAAILLLSGCTKEKLIEQNQNLLQEYFENNILNNNFAVHLATNEGSDITAQYSGYLFKLTKGTTLLSGSMTSELNGTTYNGTWASNDDYSKLTITLPNNVAVFSFLNREWRFTKKSTSLMELAPWGTTEAKVLHMQKQ